MTTPSPSVERTEVLLPGPAEGLAGILGATPPTLELPPLWHLVYLLDRPAPTALGPDGHPRKGLPAPPAAGQSRLFAGGRLITRASLRLGEPATRITQIAATSTKVGRSGALEFVTVRHEYSQRGRVIVVDEHDIVYRAGRGPTPTTTPVQEPVPQRSALMTWVVDEALLFQFSALTYNAHRIHYDSAWARYEGHQDLVIHGPLQALMMAESLTERGHGLEDKTFSYRLVRPAVGPQTITVIPGEDEGSTAEVRDHYGAITATGTVT